MSPLSRSIRPVVVQVLTDPREVVDHGDADLREMCGRSDAGDLQQVRRVDGAPADEGLLSRPDPLLDTAAQVAHPGTSKAIEGESAFLHPEEILQNGDANRLIAALPKAW